MDTKVAARAAPIAPDGSGTGRALPACEKHEYFGAVTLVHFSIDGSLLFVGVGHTLYIYETASGDLVAQHDILTRGILHGCDFVPSVAGNDTIRNIAVFFGQKRVACVHNLPQSRDEAEATAPSQQLQRFAAGKRATKVFSDWVFDVRILSKEVNPRSTFPLLAVGLAHNFIQIWEPEHDHVVRTVQCAERCILYALAFHGRSSEELVVASGTVFQQILLWKPISAKVNEVEAKTDDGDETVVPAQRLHSHDGVLFKLEWSSDASMLASVSDDRTVQLWSNRDTDEFPERTPTRAAGGFFKSTEQTVAFMSALSDKAIDNVTVNLGSAYCSVFRSWGHTARLWDVKFCAYGLATTSEDSLCKLWDFAGNCIASLQGHMGKHVWRVAVHPSQAIVATGGTDGAVKLWNVHDQIKSTSANSTAFCQSIPLFSHENSHLHEKKKTKTKGKAKTLSIRDIVVDQRHGETGFVASELGQIFKIDIKAQTSLLFFSVGDEAVALENGSIEEEGDAVTSPLPSNLSTFTTDSLNKVLLAGSSMGVVSIVDIVTATLTCEWKAHTTRVVKIFWTRDDKNGSSDSLFTVCADCTIREWRPVVTTTTTSENGANKKEELHMELLATYKTPGKCSASALLVMDRVMTRNIVCGDGRGNVFVFQRPLNLQGQSNDNDSEPQTPSLVLKSVHGREQVTSFLMRDNVLLSGGHDGYLCSYLVDFTTPEGELSLKFIGHDSIKGMTTIKNLWWNDNQELLVLGFYASQAILHNFTSQYRLFSIECGGWRRPHALVTKTIDSSLAHTFLFTPPVTNKADLLELKIHSTLTQCAPTFAQPVLGKASLHHQFHGKMTTCVAKLGVDRLVTAAEDNSVKLHKLTLSQPVIISGGEPKATAEARWQCISTGVAHTTTVRALTSFRVRDAYILLSGGGKQRINVWKVSDGVDVIEHVCGFEKEDSLQDHRILGLETFVLRPPGSDKDEEERYRLVAACNSEGAVQLLLLDLVLAKLMEVGEVSSSKKPILSCAGFQQQGENGNVVAVLAVGSTDGMISVWNFAGLVRELEVAVLDQQLLHTSTSAALTDLVPVTLYLAHDMGVNCLAIAHHDAETFSIISGGDDQNVRLRELSTTSLLLLQSDGENEAGAVSDTRAINASGSAIKAIYSDGRVVFIAGYDQRVSKWAIVSEDNGNKKAKKTLVWQCAAFSECADIANVAVSEEPESCGDNENGAHVVVVVGQGLQTFRFRK